MLDLTPDPLIAVLAEALPPILAELPVPQDWRAAPYGSVSRRVRVYARPDGTVTVTVPAWHDALSPFGYHLGQVRRWYEQAPSIAVWTLHHDGLRTLPEMVAARAAALRRNLRGTFEPWIALFPFDPFTATEEAYYEWACRNATGYGRWVPHQPFFVESKEEPIRHICTVGDRFYVAMTRGRTGTREPSHTEGEVSDGGVVWRYFGTGTHYGDCDRADLPSSREYRNQWRVSLGGVVEDPVLVTAELRRRLLIERDRRLKESGELLLTAMETGEGVETVKAYRRALRAMDDLPLDHGPMTWPVLTPIKEGAQ